MEQLKFWHEDIHLEWRWLNILIIAALEALLFHAESLEFVREHKFSRLSVDNMRLGRRRETKGHHQHWLVWHLVLSHTRILSPHCYTAWCALHVNTSSLVVGNCPGQTFELNHYYTVTWNYWKPDLLTKVVNQVRMMLNWRLGGLISAFSQDQVGPLRINKLRWLLWFFGPLFPPNSFILVVLAYLEAANTNISAKLLNDVVH